MRCPQCDHKNLDQSRVCASCGSALVDSPPSQSPGIVREGEARRTDEGPVQIGKVINEAIEIYLTDFLKQAAVLLIFAVPFFVAFGGYVLLFGGAEATSRLLGIGALLVVLISLLSVMVAAQTSMAFQHLRKRKVSVGESLGRAAAVAVPVIGAALLASVAVLAGLALLIVPGLLVMSTLALTPAVIVEEGAGAVGALRRSVSLTRGVRWPIFWVLVLINLVGLILRPALGLLVEHLGLAVVFMRLLLDLFLVGLQVTAMVVVYNRLCAFEERADVDDVDSATE